MRTGQVLNYDGTNYRIKEVTGRAIAIGEASSQIVWVTKQWVIDQGFRAKVGRSPAWLYL